MGKPFPIPNFRVTGLPGSHNHGPIPGNKFMHFPLPFQKSTDAVSMSDGNAAVVGKAYFPARMAASLSLKFVQEACKAEKLQTAPEGNS